MSPVQCNLENQSKCQEEASNYGNDLAFSRESAWYFDQFYQQYVPSYSAHVRHGDEFFIQRHGDATIYLESGKAFSVEEKSARGNYSTILIETNDGNHDGWFHWLKAEFLAWSFPAEGGRLIYLFSMASVRQAFREHVNSPTIIRRETESTDRQGNSKMMVNFLLPIRLIEEFGEVTRALIPGLTN